MKIQSRKLLCSIVFFLIVFHLLFPISFEVPLGGNAESSLCGTGVFLWEFFQPKMESAKISGESSRYFFQSVRKNVQKTIPVGMSTGFALKTQPAKVHQYLSIGIIFSMMFLTIIVYIFRSDGKKRYVNN